jgi:hypothetical protein
VELAEVLKEEIKFELRNVLQKIDNNYYDVEVREIYE